MIVILGLVIPIAAVIAGVAGVLSNSGSGHALTLGFAGSAAGGTGCVGPRPSRRQVSTRNRGPASPPPDSCRCNRPSR